ncbi:MAG: LysR family transcriptional regulator [Alphaproteobacteria bacterium]
MADIDPRKLMYFAAVVDHGSLNRAAKALAVSQPALSTSMDRLETELGLKLLERSPTGILPTKYGDILYCHARLIREEIELASKALVDARDGDQDAIRVGSLPSLAGGVMPVALSKWRETHPEQQLQVVENAQIDLLTGLVRRDFDFVIGLTEVFDIRDGLRQRVLFRDSLCVIASPSHPLRDVTDLSWADLVRYPWISPTSRRTHTVLEHVMKTMNVGLPDRITVCGSIALLASLVEKSDHLAVLPKHAVRNALAEGQLLVLPMEDAALHRNIAVFFREGYEMDQPRRDLVDCVAQVGLELCRDCA